VRFDPRASRGVASWKACRRTTSVPDEGDVALKCPTEVQISDPPREGLADQGFAPLVHCKGPTTRRSSACVSCHKTRVYGKELHAIERTPRSRSLAVTSGAKPWPLVPSRAVADLHLVGHFSATSPSSVREVVRRQPSTRPPPRRADRSAPTILRERLRHREPSAPGRVLPTDTWCGLCRPRFSS